MKPTYVLFVTPLFLFWPGSLAGQQPSERVPVYRVTVVQHSIKAINYRHRSAPTRVDFRGTVLDPNSKGEAFIENKRGATEIQAKFEKLQPPARYGTEYLTYVLWAITPEGRATNLGELVLDADNKSKLDVTTEMQAFGLMITAEPYRSVTQPSDVVVMENAIRPDTVGKIETVEAKYELLPRGHYTMHAGLSEPSREGKKVSMKEYEALLALYQARNAVQIAQAQGAERYAVDTFHRAEALLKQAERNRDQKVSSKQIITTAREATQTAEDARVITIRRQEEERQAMERRMSAEREARARAEAEDADRARREAERTAQDRAAVPNVSERVEPEPTSGELFQSLRSLAETRQNARGLVVNFYEDLFEPEGAVLLPRGREKLASIAGMLAANPGLKVEVEGYGIVPRDQDLSGRRASIVRDYLVAQGVPAVSITARGLTMRPPADSPQTRHVEIVISGPRLSTSLR